MQRLLTYAFAVLIISSSFLCSKTWAQSERWEYVTSSTDGTRFYIDNQSRRIVNGNVRIWEKSESDKKSTVDLIEYDCAQRRSRTLQTTTTYSSQNGNGTTTAPRQPTWFFITPGTVGEPIINAVCRKSAPQRKLPQSAPPPVPKGKTGSFAGQNRSGTYYREDASDGGDVTFREVKRGGVKVLNFYISVHGVVRGTCTGEHKGRAKWIDSNIAEYNSDFSEVDLYGNKGGCRFTFIFSGNRVTIRGTGCEDYHGAMCGFDGTYVLPSKLKKSTRKSQ